MSILTFFPRRAKQTAPAGEDWSQQELAEFYRALHLLRQNGVIVGLDRGTTDRGDPWLVLIDETSQEVFVHIARIGSYCILIADAVGLRIEAASIAELIPRFETAVRSLVQDQSTQNANVVLHPTARVLLSIAVLFVLAKLQSTSADAASYATGVTSAEDLPGGVPEFVHSTVGAYDDGLRKSSLQSRLQTFIQRAAELADSPFAIAVAAQFMVTAILWEIEPERHLVIPSRRVPLDLPSDEGAHIGTSGGLARDGALSEIAMKDVAAGQWQPDLVIRPEASVEISASFAVASKAPSVISAHVDAQDSQHVHMDGLRAEMPLIQLERSERVPEMALQRLSATLGIRDMSAESAGHLSGQNDPFSKRGTEQKSEGLESYNLLTSVIGQSDDSRVFALDGVTNGALVRVERNGTSNVDRTYLTVELDQHSPAAKEGPDLIIEKSAAVMPAESDNLLADRFSANDDAISFSSLDQIFSHASYQRVTHVEGDSIAFALKHVIIAFRQSEIEMSEGDVLLEQVKAETLDPSELGIWVNTMADGSRLVIVGTAQLVESFEHFVLG